MRYTVLSKNFEEFIWQKFTSWENTFGGSLNANGEIQQSETVCNK